MKIIIGLGNPGEKYKLTRHNAGFMAVDALASRLNLSWEKNKKLNADIAKDKNVILVKPLTYKNDSGQAARAALSYYKICPPSCEKKELGELLTVIHDDIDIDLGKYKIASDSRSAGHNGVQSIIDYLKTQKFQRIRIGVRAELKEKMAAEKFVLENFRPEELKIINKLILEITEKFPGALG